MEDLADFAEAACAGTHAAVFETFVTVLIVDAAFFAVREDFVGFCNLLEFFLCGRIIRMQIGVVLTGELAVDFFQFIVGDISADAQHLIIITFVCHNRIYTLSV